MQTVYPPPVPPGLTAAYWGDDPPAGWLVCDGASYARVDYPELHAAMAPAYRSADSFRVPDLRGRFALGASSARPLGATGGEESHALTEAEGPKHDHTAVGGNRGFIGGGAAGSPAYIGVGDSWRVNTVAASGEGRPHNNMPPYEACNWIISTGRS